MNSKGNNRPVGDERRSGRRNVTCLVEERIQMYPKDYDKLQNSVRYFLKQIDHCYRCVSRGNDIWKCENNFNSLQSVEGSDDLCNFGSGSPRKPNSEIFADHENIPLTAR